MNTFKVVFVVLSYQNWQNLKQRNQPNWFDKFKTVACAEIYKFYF